MTELERLEAEKAAIQAQIDALPKVQSVIEEARERFAVECTTIAPANHYRSGLYDDQPRMLAMVKIVQELRDAKERIAELEARDAVMTVLGDSTLEVDRSEPALVDPNLPLEVYHPDGRVVDVELYISSVGCRFFDIHPNGAMQVWRVPTRFKLNGKHLRDNSDWRIRNKAVQS